MAKLDGQIVLIILVLIKFEFVFIIKNYLKKGKQFRLNDFELVWFLYTKKILFKIELN